MMFRNRVQPDELKSYYPAIFAETNKETLSDKYLYIPTYKLVEGLHKQGFEIVGAKQQGSRSLAREHAKHVIYMTPHNYAQNYQAKVGETIPMIALTNSHNGLSSFKIDSAFFRLVCSNGLMASENTHNSARIVHKKGMENDVIEAAFRVVQEFPKQLDQFKTMQATQLDSAERKLLASSAMNLAFESDVIELNQSLKNSIDDKLLRPRRSADQGMDLWSTFNVIQENVIKGGFRIVRENEQGRRSLARTRSVNAIDRDSKLNKELMALAQKMLELKTGSLAV